LFDKTNYKFLFIWPISVLLSLFFKLFAINHTDILLINNYLVSLLVFGPSLFVTLILVLSKLSKN